MSVFIRTKALFRSENSDLVNNDAYIYDDYCFDLFQLESFNPSEIEDHTTIHLKSGYDIVVAIAYDDIFELLSNNTMTFNLSQN